MPASGSNPEVVFIWSEGELSSSDDGEEPECPAVVDAGMSAVFSTPEHPGECALTNLSSLQVMLGGILGLGAGGRAGQGVGVSTPVLAPPSTLQAAERVPAVSGTVSGLLDLYGWKKWGCSGG